MNRETWLEAAVTEMRLWFDRVGYPLPEQVQVAVGWPKNRGGKTRPLGQTFDPDWTGDGSCQVFITPSLGDPVLVLAQLLHELCHAAVGTGIGHSGPFVKLIRKFGLAGKATETYCLPDSLLERELSALSVKLGEYPHSAMNTRRLASTRPPGGGWVKFRSSQFGDGYILRVSPKSLADHGPPHGPNGEEMERCK